MPRKMPVGRNACVRRARHCVTNRVRRISGRVGIFGSAKTGSQALETELVSGSALALDSELASDWDSVLD